MKKHYHILLLFLIITQQLAAQKLPVVIPESVNLNTVQLSNIDRVVNDAMDKKEIPGAVIAIVRENKVGYLKAFGNKQVYPTPIPMDIHTVFDLASCTKPLATAISTFILIDRGYLTLTDPVEDFIPKFKSFKNDSITKSIQIIDLLTHTSGLPAYAPVSELMNQKGDLKEVLKEYISTCNRLYEPKIQMTYSCLNYITLQYIIETISQQSLQEFTQDNIYRPLKLSFTTFNPSDNLKALCAPTELLKDGTLLLGNVHDPLARIMNQGISGNAGLFSTAEEVALLTSIFINKGKANKIQILSPASVEKMSHLPFGLSSFGRTPGWDMNSPYSSNKGDLFSDETYGHTGYTGTSILINQKDNLALILLTNAVHPYDKGKTIRLRKQIANIVAASVGTAGNEGYLNHYAERNTQFENEKKITSRDIVFLGDSHIENGGNWNKKLHSKRIINRGIIGDNTQGVLNRLTPIVQGKPKQIFLSVGVNDISQGLNNYTLLENIEKIIQKILEVSPHTKVTLQTLMPFNEKKSWYRLLKGKSETIQEFNTFLKELASKYQLDIVDAYDYFIINGTNQLRPELTNDGLHLTEEGYKIWSELLNRYIL